MGLIQTAEQLRFSFQAIIEGAKELSKSCEDTEVFNIYKPLVSSWSFQKIKNSLIKTCRGETF